MDLSTIKFEASPSFGVRGPNKISMVIIHACAGTMLGTVATFKNSQNKVSAHYVIDRDGSILQMVKLENAAWHAMHYPNLVSIGIEHVDRYNLAGTLTRGCMQDRNWYTKPQLDASAALVAQLIHDYDIPLAKVIGHNDPQLRPYGNTHQDPGPYWPWLAYRNLIQQELDKLNHPRPVIEVPQVEEPGETQEQIKSQEWVLSDGDSLQVAKDIISANKLDGRSFKKKRLIKRKP